MDQASDPSRTEQRYVVALSPAAASAGTLRTDMPGDFDDVVELAEIGFAAGLNAVAATHPDRDVIVVAEACRLSAGWPSRLQAAAYLDDTVFAATVLTAHSEAELGPVPDPVRPRWTAPQAACTYIRRSAISLLGPFDEAFAEPAEVLAAYAARALTRGLSCLLADDVVGILLSPADRPSPADDSEELSRAYPWLAAVRAEETVEVGPLRRSLAAARSAGRELTVTLDGRMLSSELAGSQTYAFGLATALATAGLKAIRIVLTSDAPQGLIDQLTARGITTISEDEARGPVLRSDIAHRPQQAFVPEDLSLLRRVGERVVVSHLDLIGFRNPTYHPNLEDWRRYRRITRIALGAVDRVVFLSEHARNDAVREELVEPQWTAVVGAAIEPEAGAPGAQRPAAVPADRPFVVMIGTDYAHKNRVFALELVEQLRQRWDWDGMLVLAGGRVPYGSSAAQEAELLRTRPELAKQVLDLGHVDGAEKAWLLANAAALLCPSTYEGFGLTPIEAAQSGIPCICAPITSLAEVVGPEAATLVEWDSAASSDRVHPLLQPGEPRERHLRSLRSATQRYRWDRIVPELVEVYREALDSPYRSSVPRAWEELGREQLIVDLDRAYHDQGELIKNLDRAYHEQKQLLGDLQDRVESGLPLIDRGGLLTPEQQQGLMRIASRRWLRRPLLGPVGALGAIRAARRDNQSTAAPR